MMTFEEFKKNSGLPENFCEPIGIKWDVLTEGWDGKLPFFLNADCFRKIGALANMPVPVESLMDRVEQIIGLAEREPDVALLAYVMHRAAFGLPYAVPLPRQEVLPKLGGNTGMFVLMISFGVFPLIQESYRKLGVPDCYAEAMLHWIGGTMRPYAMAHNGLPGRPMAFDWLRRYVNGELFRIGRLEYLMHPYIEWMPAVFRNSRKELAVLCRDWVFRKDGYRVWPYEKEEIAYRTTLSIGDNSITGTPVKPDGIPEFGKTVTLDLSEWKPIAAPWDLCPSLHIPGGEKMPFSEVKASLLQAREFFAKYFGKKVPVFCCCSWILTPVWEDLFEHSNMAEFRKQCYAVPSVPWGRKGGMAFLYGRDDVSPEDLPAVNTAQKVYREAYRQNRTGSGAIFIPADEIENLGDCYFRRRYGQSSGM